MLSNYCLTLTEQRFGLVGLYASQVASLKHQQMSVKIYITALYEIIENKIDLSQESHILKSGELFGILYNQIKYVYSKSRKQTV